MDETKYSRIRMMKMNRFLYILVVSFMALLVSCEDDDSIFSGDENFITSFRLLQDGNTYTGLVSGDTLLLLVPENVSLEGAKVEIVCSENASVHLIRLKWKIGERRLILRLLPITIISGFTSIWLPERF